MEFAIDGEVATLANTPLLTTLLRTKDAKEFDLQYLSGGFEGHTSRLTREELLEFELVDNGYCRHQILSLITDADEMLVKSNLHEYPITQIVMDWDDLEHEVDYGFIAYLVRKHKNPLKAWDEAAQDIEKAILDALADIAAERGQLGDMTNEEQVELIVDQEIPVYVGWENRELVYVYWENRQLVGEDSPWAQFELDFGQAWTLLYE